MRILAKYNFNSVKWGVQSVTHVFTKIDVYLLSYINIYIIIFIYYYIILSISLLFYIRMGYNLDSVLYSTSTYNNAILNSSKLFCNFVLHLSHE
jgi:hypothetical protein